jgi:hypothetical protein
MYSITILHIPKHARPHLQPGKWLMTRSGVASSAISLTICPAISSSARLSARGSARISMWTISCIIYANICLLLVLFCPIMWVNTPGPPPPPMHSRPNTVIKCSLDSLPCSCAWFGLAGRKVIDCWINTVKNITQLLALTETASLHKQSFVSQNY